MVIRGGDTGAGDALGERHFRNLRDYLIISRVFFELSPSFLKALQ